MTTDNPVTLRAYIEKKQVTITEFAASCGLGFYQVQYILRGGSPPLKNAIRIERFTNGEVTCKTLLPEKQFKEIIEQEEKIKG